LLVNNSISYEATSNRQLSIGKLSVGQPSISQPRHYSVNSWQLFSLQQLAILDNYPLLNEMVRILQPFTVVFSFPHT